MPLPAPTTFLFRAEVSDGLPVFYVLSRIAPRDTTGKWRVEPREYRPDLRPGDRLAFKLRANPIVERPGDAVIGGDGAPKLRKSGARAGEAKQKVLRHDVVMDAKQRMGWKNMLPDDRPSLAHVAYEAGSCWLRKREDRLGCRVEPDSLRVDGHANHCLKGRRDENGRCRGIALSTLDFEGELQVTDPVRFLNCLLSGVGPAKSFGCSLLLVRRIS
jgi:CRISPR system Cascade subunit CasE